MCEFCVKHGEGKKWYLNVKNYSNDLLNDIKRHTFIENVTNEINALYPGKFLFFKSLPLRVPVLGNVLKGLIKRKFLSTHWGQVIPIEDVERIFNFTNSITRIPCICRKIITGKEERVCFLISIDPSKTGIADIVDQSFFGGPDVARFEKVNKEWAIDFIKKNEVAGMIHTVWTFKTPFIGALCNCDFSAGCIALKLCREITPVLFKAEYIAVVNKDKCVGCHKCIKLCQFNAIKFDRQAKKITIDKKKCSGCGICRSVCYNNTISLQERFLIPETANLWE